MQKQKIIDITRSKSSLLKPRIRLQTIVIGRTTYVDYIRRARILLDLIIQKKNLKTYASQTKIPLTRAFLVIRLLAIRSQAINLLKKGNRTTLYL